MFDSVKDHGHNCKFYITDYKVLNAAVVPNFERVLGQGSNEREKNI
jgi:hypothetical protein